MHSDQRAAPIFDAVLIGTGPAMLFEGLCRAESGQRVMFVDRAERIGGSWRTATAFGFPDIETGVHLLENRRGLNAALLDLMGPDAMRMASDDFAMIGRVRIRMNLGRPLLHAVLVLKALAQGRAGKAAHASRHLRDALASLSTPFLYPRNGFGAVLAALDQRLTQSGALFRFSAEVIEADFAQDGLVVRTSEGLVTARELITSSRAHPTTGLPGTTEGAASRKVRADIVRTLCLHIYGACHFAGYVELLGDPFVKRIRRLDFPGSHLLGPECSVLAVQTRAVLAQRQDTDDDATVVLAHLRDLGLLGEDVRLLGVERFDHHLCTIDHRSAARHARRTFSLSHLETVDLSDAPFAARTDPHA